MKEISNRIVRLGDDIESSQIIVDDFTSRIQGGKVLVAGARFGSGTTATQAVAALKAVGISCVIAKSFGRAFFREAINHGLPVVAGKIADEVNDGDKVTVDFEQGMITYPGGETRFPPYPELVLKIIATGDLVAALKKESRRK